MIIDFDIYKFLERMLPVHKRQTNRLKLFYWPLKSVKAIWDSFKVWRKDVLFRANITGQMMSLEVYLNKYVDGAFNGISIIESEGSGLWCGLEAEQDEMFEIGLEVDEPADYIELEIEGEEGTTLPVSFRVIAPPTANVEQIKKHVQIYKIAGKSFDVQNS